MLLHLLLALCVPLWSYGEGTSQQLPSCQEVIGTNDSFSAQCILMTGRSREKQPPGLDEEPADKQPKVALVQEDPAPPKAELNMEGQSKSGNEVLDMLNFIVKNTQKEESEAHADEEKAQADYEDSMQKLKDQQAADEKSLSKLQDDLAQAEKDLLDAREDKKATTEDKEEAEDYLARIKPGCDFIKSNFKLRNANRKTEKAALTKAIGLIKATPAYKTAVNAATVESYGDCKSCEKDEADVKCKACMADVTIPAYCAGHKGTKGC